MRNGAATDGRRIASADDDIAAATNCFAISKRVGCRIQLIAMCSMMVSAFLVAMPAECEPSATAMVSASSAPLEFRHDDGDLWMHAGVAAAFVLVVAIGAAFVVKQAGRGGILQRLGASGSTRSTNIRVVNLRRLTSRLSIVTVEIDQSKTVIFADNGQSLLMLASKEMSDEILSNGDPQ